MTSFNPLATILSQKPLDGNNYDLWKTNLFIVLDFERIKFITTTPKPQEPTANASEETKKQFADWQRANMTARCYILASVAEHLRKQINDLESVLEIIQTLDGMFAKSSSTARQAAIGALMNTRMTGGNVRDHCLKMMGHISTAEVMGAKLDQEMKIDLILESLPNSFGKFKLNYIMNNFKPKSKVVLEELDSVRDPPQPLIFPPLFPVDVQRGENVQNVPESEQTQETAQDQIQETQEQEHNEEIGNPPEPQNLDPSVHVQQPMQQTRSGRLIRKPARYALLGETYQVVLDNPDDDPTTYEEALEDVDVQEWKKAMDREMESMGSNSVWSLIEAPKGVKPIGCKWIYKRKRGPDGKVETFKARLVAKGYTQKEGIDYDETFSPVAMLKSVRILLAVAAALDYEIWQMDVKTTFLNGELEEDIYMQQPKGFIALSQEHMVCKLHRSIYGLKQASRSWNIRFDQVIKLYGFEKSPDEPCLYKKIQGIVVVFLVLYVDDILLIKNSVKVLSDVKGYLKKQFDMKDLGEANYILGIKLLRDRKNKVLALSKPPTLIK